MLVGMDHPNSEGQGYDGKKGEYIPISLQYRPYTAESDSVRPVSLAGNSLEDGTQENRSYLGRTAYTLRGRLRRHGPVRRRERQRLRLRLRPELRWGTARLIRPLSASE